MTVSEAKWRHLSCGTGLMPCVKLKRRLGGQSRGVPDADSFLECLSTRLRRVKKKRPALDGAGRLELKTLGY